VCWLNYRLTNSGLMAPIGVVLQGWLCRGRVIGRLLVGMLTSLRPCSSGAARGLTMTLCGRLVLRHRTSIDWSKCSSTVTLAPRKLALAGGWICSSVEWNWHLRFFDNTRG